MNRSSVIKCDLIPNCSMCRWDKGNAMHVVTIKKCNVAIPDYIPDDQIEKMLQKFKEKYHI